MISGVCTPAGCLTPEMWMNWIKKEFILVSDTLQVCRH